MKKTNKTKTLNVLKTCLTAIVAIIMAIIMTGSFSANASVSSLNPEGRLYYLDKDDDYGVSSSFGHVINVQADTGFGSFYVSGDISSAGNVNGFTAYEVNSETVDFLYTLNESYGNDGEYYWHAYEDGDDEIDGVELDNDIISGAVIVQTSLTGSDWITDAVYTDIRNAESGFSHVIYDTRTLQQLNGCYYRIIVAYEQQKRVEDRFIFGIPVTNHEYRRIAEVYCLYIYDGSENVLGKVSPSATPMMNLTGMDSKINTGTNNGFSGHEDITRDDPHYGWEMGTFFVNGYTSCTYEDSVPVLLKNVGDRVTLWFNLKQDINRLNGNEDLKVNRNNGGSDQQFEIERTDFGRGTLIIRYTDYRNESGKPTIYTNYLEACARTGSDTMVELFEEGDYEIALDYELVDENGFDTYTDYRMYFRFKIRNGNCMAYPFDIMSGNELSDGSITANGFRLDLARSRYLTVNVERKGISFAGGRYSEDTRFSRTARDGESYTDEGVYIFTVTNRYTSQTSVVKKIYVGSSPIMKALAGSDKSLAEINSCLDNGAELLEDGSIIYPEPEPVIEEINKDEQDRMSCLSLVPENENTGKKTKFISQALGSNKSVEAGNAVSSLQDRVTVGSIAQSLNLNEWLDWLKDIAIVVGIPMLIVIEMKRLRRQKKQV